MQRVFLITNDDGYGAPGIEALLAALQGLGRAIVVAPERHLSGCGHKATIHRPLRADEIAADRFRVDGAPVDCVRLGLLELCPQATWLIAGVNEGGNLGSDVYPSGTVAAAREGALWGRPAIAFSQYLAQPGAPDWTRTARWTRSVVEEALKQEWTPGEYWNVNLPDTNGDEHPKRVACPLDPHPQPVRFEGVEGGYAYRGRYQERGRLAGHDVDHCFSGRITISRLGIGLEAHPHH